MATAVSPTITKAVDEPATKEDSLAVLKALAEISAVFIALMFITGWSYLASYYRTFGANPLELTISVPVVATFGFDVLTAAKWPLIIAGILLLLVAVFSHWVRRMRGIIMVCLAFLLVASAGVGMNRGRLIANQDTRVDSSSLPNVAFSSNLQDPSLPPCVDYKTFGSFDCKLLMHFNNTYYFFQPVPQAADAANMNLNLYQLPESSVVGVHVQRGLDASAKLIK